MESLNFHGALLADHHYVPKCYLLGFTDPAPPPSPKPEPMIWQAELKSNRIRLRPTRKVGYATGFYALGLGTPEQDDFVEQAHGKLETVVAPILRRLNSGNYRIGDESWEYLLHFAALLATRGPNTRSVLEGAMRRSNEVLMDLLANLPPEGFLHQLRKAYPDRDYTIEDARKFQAWGKNHVDYPFKHPPHLAVVTSVKGAFNSIYPIFRKLCWSYLHPPSTCPFLCSDSPIVWINPSVQDISRGHGLLAPHVEITFPIGRSLALLGRWETGPHHLDLSAEQTDLVNRRAVRHASVEILGPSRASVEWGLALLNETQST